MLSDQFHCSIRSRISQAVYHFESNTFECIREAGTSSNSVDISVHNDVGI